MLDLVGLKINYAIKILDENKKTYRISKTYPPKKINIDEENLFVVKQIVQNDDSYLLIVAAKMRKEV